MRSEVFEKIRDRQCDVQMQATFYHHKIGELQELLLKLKDEKTDLKREISNTKAGTSAQKKMQSVNESKIQIGQGQVELLHEEIADLKELLGQKKDQGEVIYTDMRDHLSSQEVSLLTVHDSTSRFVNHHNLH